MLPTNSRTRQKKPFPLTLTYAMTGHKAQGATVRHTVIIGIQNAFAAVLEA